MSLITNKKVSLNYQIIEKITAGIKLLGFEVKSLKNSKGSLDSSYVTIRGGEAFLIGMFIPPYQEKNTIKEYDPYRNRKLLLNKKEIAELEMKEKTTNLTIVPISVYNKGNILKLEIALVKGKKKFDKREDLKKRESDKRLRQEFKVR